MRLKVAAIAMMITDVILFITGAALLTTYPGRHAPKSEQANFVIRSGILTIVLLLSLLTTVILVWLWMQALREEYREEAKRNMESLIEGTLRDHERKTT